MDKIRFFRSSIDVLNDVLMSNFIILLALYFSVLASQRVGETIISDLWNNCTLRPSDNRNLTFTSLSFFPVLINAFTVVIYSLLYRLCKYT